MQDLLTELLSYRNAVIMAVTWAAVEAMTPLVGWLVMRPIFVSRRLALYELAKRGKQLAAVIWCSVLVWVPTAQPGLCNGGDTPECQTVFNRVAIGVILGVALSSGHFAGAAAMRKLLGRKKKHKIACANCKAKYTAESWDTKCPKCAQSPHVVTKTNW